MPKGDTCEMEVDGLLLICPLGQVVHGGDAKDLPRGEPWSDSSKTSCSSGKLRPRQKTNLIHLSRRPNADKVDDK